MEQRNRQPSFIRMINVDAFARHCLVIPLWCWALTIFLIAIYFAQVWIGLDRTSAETMEEFAYTLDSAWLLSIVSPFIAWPLLAWRLRSLRNIFSNGILTPGQVTDAKFLGSYPFLGSFLKNYTQVKVAYHIDGKQYQAKNTIHKKLFKTLDFKQPVTLVVNARKPQQALVRDFYLPNPVKES